MIFKMNHLFWEQNESTGYRHISVEDADNCRVLFAVTAYNVCKEWTAQVIPMGFSFQQNEVQALSEAFQILPSLMTFMCRDTISAEEMQNFLLTIQ